MNDQKTEVAPIKWRERLMSVHQSLHDTMAQLIERKDYVAAESLLRITDRMVLDLIDDAGGQVVRPDAETL